MFHVGEQRIRTGAPQRRERHRTTWEKLVVSYPWSRVLQRPVLSRASSSTMRCEVFCGVLRITYLAQVSGVWQNPTMVAAEELAQILGGVAQDAIHVRRDIFFVYQPLAPSP